LKKATHFSLKKVTFLEKGLPPCFGKKWGRELEKAKPSLSEWQRG